MRAKIGVSKLNGEEVPFNYLYGLSSMLYHRLAQVNVELANEAHSPNEFRHFNFSLLKFQEPYEVNDGFDFEKGHFYVSSPDDKFIKSYTQGVLSNSNFHLGDADLEITSVEVLPNKELGSIEEFKTLSPIYLKTKRRNEETDELEEWDLAPSDGKWYENIHNNLLKRYKDFHGHSPEEDHFHIRDIHQSKRKRIRIRNCWRRCSHVDFTLEASSELMNFAYQAGLGEKTGMGFGYIEVV